MKKTLGTQTLRAGCSKAEPKISPHRRPPSRWRGTQKFNQLEIVTTFTYKPSLVRIDARNFELSWSQTHKHTHTQTERGDYNTLRRSLARSVITKEKKLN